MKDDFKRFVMACLLGAGAAVTLERLGWLGTYEQRLEVKGVALVVIAAVFGVGYLIRSRRNRS